MPKEIPAKIKIALFLFARIASFLLDEPRRKFFIFYFYILPVHLLSFAHESKIADSMANEASWTRKQTWNKSLNCKNRRNKKTKNNVKVK